MASSNAKRLATLIRRCSTLDSCRWRSAGPGITARSDLALFRYSTSSHHTRSFKRLRHDRQPNHSRQSTSSSRRYSTVAQRPGLRVSHVVGALLVFGLGVTAWGLYDIYTSLTTWPKEIRDDLRMGLRAKYRGDLKLSQRYLARAWTTLLTLPATYLTPEPYLKSSGLLIALAEVFEQDEQPLKAYWMYALAVKSGSEDIKVPEELLQEANKCLTPASDADSGTSANSAATETPTETNPVPLPDNTPLTKQGRLRLVSLALKLGDMAPSLKRPLVEEYFWLNLAVAHIGKVITDELGTKSRVSADWSNAEAKVEGNDDSSMELSLPAWASFLTTKSGKLDAETFAAPYERLGELYARVGDMEHALANFHYAAILLDKFGGNDEHSKIVNRCRKAQIHNNSAEALIRHFQQLQYDDSVSSSSSPGASSSSGSSAAAPSKPENILTSAVYFAASAYNAADGCIDNSTPDLAGSSGDGAGRQVDAKNVNMELWGLCVDVLPVAAYNLGVIYEMQGERRKARALFEWSLQISNTFSFAEGVKEARAALRRMDREDRSVRREKDLKDGTRAS